MTSAKPMRQSQPAGDPDPRWTAIATRDTRSDGHRPDRIPIPGADIRFAIVRSALGYVLVARSAKGVCAVLMGDSPSLLERDLRRSEEHTSELQSQSNLVCRLLLEKKQFLRRGSLALTNR